MSRPNVKPSDAERIAIVKAVAERAMSPEDAKHRLEPYSYDYFGVPFLLSCDHIKAALTAFMQGQIQEYQLIE